MTFWDKELAVRKPRSTARRRRLARAAGDQQCGMQETPQSAAQQAAKTKSARQRRRPRHMRPHKGGGRNQATAATTMEA